MYATTSGSRSPRTAQLKAAGRALLAVAGTVLLAVAFVAAFLAAFAAAWRHVRFTPRLVDSWPAGAGGFGLSCAAAVLAGRAGLVRSLRRPPGAGRLAGALVCGAALLLGGLYGVAVVPPRWCYQSTSPHCASLPGAAEAGLAFLGTLIGAYVASSVLSGVPARIRRLARAGRFGDERGTGEKGERDGGGDRGADCREARPRVREASRTVTASRSARTPPPAPAACPTAAARRRVGRSARR